MLVLPGNLVAAVGLDEEMAVTGFDDDVDKVVGAAFEDNDDVVGGGGMLAVVV